MSDTVTGHKAHELRLDATSQAAAQAGKVHNRWRPAIAPALKVNNGGETGRSSPPTPPLMPLVGI